MRKNNKLKKNFSPATNLKKKPFQLIIILSLIAVIGILLLLIVRIIQYKKTLIPVDNPIPTQSSTIFTPSKKICDVYGVVENDVISELLDTYTVKSGDTLISIANNVLHNPDSVSDLYTLNKNRYPGLQERSSIETGWKLLLPNEELMKRKYSVIWKASGNIFILESGKFVIKSQTRYVLGAHEVSARMQKSLGNIQDGDCVVVYLGRGSGWDSEVYLLKSQ